MQRIVEYVKSYQGKKVYTTSSLYTALLATCVILLTENTRNSYIIMFSPEKKVLKTFYQYSLKMQSYGIKNAVVDKKTKIHRAIGLSDIENKCLFNKVMKELNTEKGKYLLVNLSWNQRIVRYPASLYYKYCEKAIFIEEGATQYITPDESKLVNFLKKVYGNQTEFWKDNKLKSVFVQFPNRYPIYLAEKMKEFSLQEFIITADEEKISILLDIFTDRVGKGEIQYLQKNCGGIIYTAPFSEDGYMNEKEKQDIFTKIAKYYQQYGKVYLKIHPRDTSEYEIEDVTVLHGSYPSELYNLLGIHFLFAVGICSSAVENTNTDRKLNLNENYLQELRFELKPLP